MFGPFGLRLAAPRAFACKTGLFGAGLYFAENSSKSDECPRAPGGWAHDSYRLLAANGLMCGEKIRKSVDWFCRDNHAGTYYISYISMCVIIWSSGDCLFRIRWWLELLSRGPSRCFNVKEITLTSMQYLDWYGHRWTDIVFVFHSCPSLSISLYIYVYIWNTSDKDKCVWFNKTVICVLFSLRDSV